MSASRPSLSLIAVTAARSAIFLGLVTTAFVATDSGRLLAGLAEGNTMLAAAAVEGAGEGTCTVIALPRPTTPIRVILPAMTDSLGPMAKLICGGAIASEGAPVADAAAPVVKGDAVVGG